MGQRLCDALADINTDMNGWVCGALVQLGCYQYEYEWKEGSVVL